MSLILVSVREVVSTWTACNCYFCFFSHLAEFKIKKMLKSSTDEILKRNSGQSLTGFQANGPGLEYKVLWRQKDVDQEWSSRTVANVSQFVVTETPTYMPYEIKVQALNDYGNGPEPEVAIGYSGEDSE